VREQEHVVMRQTTAEVPQLIPLAETSLSVTPRTEASVSVNASASARFVITTPFGDIPLVANLFNVNELLADVRGTNWSEDARLRLGTYTAASELSSHWPRTGRFPALPTSTSTCVAATEATGDIEPACDSMPGVYPGGRTTAPQAHLCILGQSPAPDQLDCVNRIWSLVSNGTGLLQNVDGKSQRSRILDIDASDTNAVTQTTWGAPLQTVITECRRELGSAAAVQSQIRVGLCDATGRFFDANRAFDPVPATTDVPNLTPNACHAP
jgi:hypothetical protein